MTEFAITGASIFTGEVMLADHALVVRNGVIDAIIEARALATSMPVTRLKDGVLAPGFVDVQVNGGGGFCVNNQPDVAALRQIASAHAKYGTTALLPTVITDAPEVMHAAIAATREALRLGTPGIIGLHCEGPFLDMARRGAHPAPFIRKAETADIDALIAADCGTLLVTLSPDQVSPADIARLVQAHVIVSLGHSDATAETAERALVAGASAFTHLFNAMSPLTHRAPGMVGAALSSRHAYCGLICDGLHVDPRVLQIALRAKNPDHFMLVSDAMPPAAGGPDHFTLQGRAITRRNGALYLEDGTLAGCDLTMDAAMRYCVHTLGLPLPTALQMAARNPARMIGQHHRIGSLAPGLQADMVHLDDSLQVRATWIAGSAISGDTIV